MESGRRISSAGRRAIADPDGDSLVDAYPYTDAASYQYWHCDADTDGDENAHPNSNTAASYTPVVASEVRQLVVDKG